MSMYVPAWPSWWPWWLNQNDLFSLFTGGLATSFSQLTFNQTAFLGNVAMRQAQVYQEKNYHLAWVGIARSDIQSMLSLTVQRINNYMLVATLILTIAATYIVSMDFPRQTSPLVVGACGLSFGVSVIFFSISIMFAVKGQNSAFTNTMRLLTWEVRPENPQPYNHDYLVQAQFMERFRDLFRLPGVTPCYLREASSAAERVGAAPAESEGDGAGLSRAGQGGWSADTDLGEVLQPSTRELLYYARYAHLMQLWEPYDQKAKYCIGLGLYSMTQGVAYFSIGTLVYDGRLGNNVAVVSMVSIMVFISWILLGHNLRTRASALLAYFLFAAGPISATIAVVLPRELFVTQFFNPLTGFSQFVLYALSLCFTELVPLHASTSALSSSTTRYVQGPAGQDFARPMRVGGDLTWDVLLPADRGAPQASQEAVHEAHSIELEEFVAHDLNEAGHSSLTVREHVDGLMRWALVLCMVLWATFALSSFFDSLSLKTLQQEWLPQLHLDEVKVDWVSPALQLSSLACGVGYHVFVTNGFVVFDIDLQTGEMEPSPCVVNGSILDVTVDCDAGGSHCWPVALVLDDRGRHYVRDCHSDWVLPLLQADGEPLQRFALAKSLNATIAVGLHRSRKHPPANSELIEYVRYAEPEGLKPLWIMAEVASNTVDIALVQGTGEGDVLWIFRSNGMEVIRKDGTVLSSESFDDLASVISGCVISEAEVTHEAATARKHRHERVSGLVLSSTIPPKLYTFSSAVCPAPPIRWLHALLLAVCWGQGLHRRA